MPFKGRINGIEFTLDGREVTMKDPILKKHIELGISLGAYGRGVNRMTVENMIGQSIVKKFNGEIIHLSDLPGPFTYFGVNSTLRVKSRLC